MARHRPQKKVTPKVEDRHADAVQHVQVLVAGTAGDHPLSDDQATVGTTGFRRSECIETTTRKGARPRVA